MRILYLDLDTLRPDHLGCYGYRRDTSPNIDRIASQGVTFTNCYCSDAPCLPSRAALFSGRFGIHTGVVGHGGTSADMRLEGLPRGFRDQMGYNSMPAVMRWKGLNTVSISPFAERHSAWWFYSGFREMYNTGEGGNESAEHVTPTALDWIARNARSDNWFLQVNYWDPHTPYRAPESFGNPFKDAPLPAWLTPEVVEKHWGMVGPHGAQEYGMYTNQVNPRYPRQPGEVRGMEGARQAIDGYDCGIRYMDEHIGQLLTALQKQGVMDDLTIIVSSDHGENLGELGMYGEHGTSDYITHRIPLIVSTPGGRRGQKSAGLHYNLDLPPTLSEIFGFESPKEWDGKSFAPAVIKEQDCGRPYLILSQCAHVCQRSVRFGPWQYIRTYHDFYHLFPQEMLFDVEKDPHEQNDLASARPEICAQATRHLLEWHDQQMATMESDEDPLWTVIREGGPFHSRGQLKKYCERLEQTGRGWAIPELKKRHPREFA